jgi:His/Glu/Gln/Arg/opine family amino acid ABC transporter permease subunit
MDLLQWLPFRLYQQRILEGVANTVLITIGALVVGFALGLLLAIARASSRTGIATPARLVIDFGRALPLLPLLYALYFGILHAGVPTTPETTGMLAIGMPLACYVAEIMRAGLAAVPPGAKDAADAMGMTPWRVRWRVTLPIATIVMLPAIGQRVVGTLLDSSVVSVIGAREITGVSRNIIDTYFATGLWWIVAVTYLLIAFPLSRLFGYLERRLSMAGGHL